MKKASQTIDNMSIVLIVTNYVLKNMGEPAVTRKQLQASMEDREFYASAQKHKETMAV